MKIKDIPWFNRPIWLLKGKGSSILSDAELLAVVFGRGNPKENADDLANRILKNIIIKNYLIYLFMNLKKETGRWSLSTLNTRLLELKNSGLIKDGQESKFGGGRYI